MRSDVIQFARFVAVGLLNTLFGYAIFAALTLIGLGPAAAVVCGTILGVLFNFQSFGRLVFGGAGARLLPRFVAVYAVQAGVNIGLLHWVVGAGVPVLLAQAVVLPPLVVMNYLLMRRFVFTAGAGFAR